SSAHGSGNPMSTEMAPAAMAVTCRFAPNQRVNRLRARPCRSWWGTNSMERCSGLSMAMAVPSVGTCGSAVGGLWRGNVSKLPGRSCDCGYRGLRVGCPQHDRSVLLEPAGDGEFVRGEAFMTAERDDRIRHPLERFGSG